jgi:hypothetical protein
MTRMSKTKRSMSVKITGLKNYILLIYTSKTASQVLYLEVLESEGNIFLKKTNL